jgi:hypothetical protein
MRNSFDPETAERLLRGELRPADAPRGLVDIAELFEALRAPVTTTALPGEAVTVAAMARAIETAGSVHDVKFAGVQTEALDSHDVTVHDVKASPTDVKRAPTPGDVWAAPPPPTPIRTPAPSPTLDRMAWVSERHTSPWRRALQPVLAKSWGERRRPLKARVAALATAAMLLSTGGAAAAGALPGPLQAAVSKTLRVVGIHVPSGREPEDSTDSRTPPVAESTPPSATTPPAAQHGKDVSDTARNTDAKGREHGREVSDVARDGHGKGPGAEHGRKGGNSEGHRQDGDHSQRSKGQSHRPSDPGTSGHRDPGSGSGSSDHEGDGSPGGGSGGSASSHSGAADHGRSGSHGSS